MSEKLSAQDGVVAISFTGVDDLATEMETLATTAQGLKDNLDELKSVLQNNWDDDAARGLLMKYDDFMSNINIITADIYAVRDWSRDTSSLFRATVNENAENVSNALGV
ncbi:MAG: hypothetical protein J6Y86_11015 [Pseudobutyrivibrio sp.]|nr:hypothetical protein [Pseudobutyrivibrio sp.]